MDFLQSLLDSSSVPAITAFILGILTAVSPCPLATNITAIGFISKDIENRHRIFINGLLYTFGRIVTYTVLGFILIPILREGASMFMVQKAVSKLENLDFNYVTSIFDGNVTFSINQLFFYTYLDNPLLLQSTKDGLYRLNNISGNTDSKGGETNVKIGYKDFHLYLGYTYTDTRTKENGVKQENILTPKHRLNSILMYEVEDKWKIGLEAYYFSPQKLGDGQKGKQYVVCGFMIEKIWEMFSLYANFENFTDRRQTRFDTIYTGSISNPVFRDIYAPLDGFVMNAGVKLRF